MLSMIPTTDGKNERNVPVDANHFRNAHILNALRTLYILLMNEFVVNLFNKFKNIKLNSRFLVIFFKLTVYLREDPARGLFSHTLMLMGLWTDLELVF